MYVLFAASRLLVGSVEAEAAAGAPRLKGLLHDVSKCGGDDRQVALVVARADSALSLPSLVPTAAAAIALRQALEACAAGQEIPADQETAWCQVAAHVLRGKDGSGTPAGAEAQGFVDACARSLAVQAAPLARLVLSLLQPPLLVALITPAQVQEAAAGVLADQSHAFSFQLQVVQAALARLVQLQALNSSTTMAAGAGAGQGKGKAPAVTAEHGSTIPVPLDHPGLLAALSRLCAAAAPDQEQQLEGVLGSDALVELAVGEGGKPVMVQVTRAA